MIIRTIIIDDPEMCHNLDQRSYLWYEGHSARVAKIQVHTLTFHW